MDREAVVEIHCAGSGDHVMPVDGGPAGDLRAASPALDRLAMHAIRINIEGASFQQHAAKSRAERALST